MKLFRFLVITATQVPLLYLELGRHDMLGGFNQTDAGFGLMVGLFIAVPLFNLGWLIFETWRSFRLSRQKKLSRNLVWPFIALTLLIEALVVDLYLLSLVRM
jgi:hypothetical protein